MEGVCKRIGSLQPPPDVPDHPFACLQLLKGKGATKPASTGPKPKVSIPVPKKTPGAGKSGTQRAGGAGYRKYDGELWISF
jgi:hypothetical protein